MGIRTLIPAAALLLGGCNNMGLGGFWYFSFGAVEGEETFGCETNADDAECPEEEDAEEGEIIVTTESEQSEPGTFGEVMEGAHGEVFLLILGYVYPGVEVEKDVFEFEHIGFNDASSRTEHEDGDYFYEVLAMQETTTTIKLTMDPKTWIVTGEVKQKFETTISEEETDEVDDEEKEFLVGRIDDFQFQWLDNTADEEDVDGRVNEPTEDDCDSDACKTTINGEAMFKQPLSGVYAHDVTKGDLGFLGGFGQSAGASDEFAGFNLGSRISF